MQSRTAMRTACAVLFIAAALAPEPIRAAEPSAPTAGTVPPPPPTAEIVPPTPASEEPSPHGRILNGHAFMPALDVPGALQTTSFVSGLLIGLGQTSGTFNVSGQPISGNFEYAGIGAVIGYEYAFLDYFSVRLALTELIFSGVTSRSALVVGTQLQGGAGAGATFSLPVGDTLRLGVLFDVSAAPNFGLTIGNGVRAIVDSCRTPQGCDVHAAGFFQQKNVVQLTPALAANWAPIPALGVTANASYIYASQRINGTTFTGDAFQVGTALDFDFAAISSVPVGLQVQFSWIAPFNGSALQHVSDVGGGIFYTGRKNLALGVQVIDRRFAVTPDLNVSWKTFLVDIGMRYYW
jgi:hypothetical protein